MKRVLVTGAAGFIGRHCLPLLAASGYEAHAVSSRLPAESTSGVQWHQADLLDPGQITGLIAEVRPTHLLHLAWFVQHGQYWMSLENFRWVRASLHLLELFARHKGRRVVAAGTCAEYDWRYGYCSEHLTPLLPGTPYGVYKHSLQIMLDSFARQTGLSAAWGRIFFIYGPGEHPERLVASVTRALLQGRPALCSTGDQIRDLLYVKDVAGAFVALLEGEVSGPVNIASGQPVALKDVVGTVAAKLNSRHLVRLGAIPSPADEPPLIVADVRRLKEEVGFSPGYDLDRGLSETIDWWRKHNASLFPRGRKS
ncbi:MAG: NAD(P)-dependent oxidoreductase [Bacillota bacterium]